MLSDLNTEEQKEVAVAEEYAPGELAPAIITKQRIWKPDEIKAEDQSLIGILTSLVNTFSVTDEAARRFSVLQCWQERHFDRGYQYLESSDKGGWSVVGAGNGSTNSRRNPLSDADDANLYPTNIYSSQGDIITAALNRGAIKVNFSPAKQKEPADVLAADAKNKYKCLWYERNECEKFQRTITDLSWTDPRVVVWTRTVADKSRFGISDDGSIGQAELSSAHGVLETKLPMMADDLKDCGYAQIFEEVDYSVARASYPWMGDKIKPSWGTFGELEFERIARINTRIGVVGKYITGTSGIREATIGYNWFRPGLYWDDKITAIQREWLLRNFPDGLFLIMAGPEVVCCWNESMDDHLTLGMFCRGFGQNRRALGSSDIPLQKRINIWADLWDKFVRTAIPTSLLENTAFNAEAVASLEANPARFMLVEPPDGKNLADCVGQTMAPTPIQGMQEVFQWYVGPLIQSIDGGTPALFGQGEGEDNTVGATQIRLQQALERVGRAWSVVNGMYESILSQAALCCAENTGSEIYGSSDNGDFEISPQDLKGNTKCKAETVNAIPESGAQREAKILQILDMAQLNQMVANEIGKPSNAREIVKGLHLDDVITVDEANWEDGALEDIERLLDSEPLINPQYAQMEQQFNELNATHEIAKAAALDYTSKGQTLEPQEIAQGAAMEQQVEQIRQQLSQMPKYMPSIPAAQDDSQDHETIAATVKSWMGEPHGRSLRRKSDEEGEGGENWKKWTNVFLYWQQHDQIAKKSQSAQAPAPRVSMTGKLTPEQQAQLLQLSAGVQTDPQTFNAPNEAETETIQRTPYQEIKTRMRRRL